VWRGGRRMQRSLARRYAGDQSSESLQRPTSNTCGGRMAMRQGNGEGVAWGGVAWVGDTIPLPSIAANGIGTGKGLHGKEWRGWDAHATTHGLRYGGE
jgi:hypothetical protein